MKGWVYFLQFGKNGPIKIGRSYNPVSRARDLNATSPVELTLLGAIKSRNMEREEREIHDSLNPFRVRGEWFDQVAVLTAMKNLAARITTAEMLSARLQAETTTGRDKRVNLRLPQRLVDLIKKAARLEQRSFNSMFELIVSEWAKARPKQLQRYA